MQLQRELKKSPMVFIGDFYIGVVRMTGVEAKAAQSGESLTEWDRRTAPKEKAPEAKATDALGELTGLKAGPTKTNEDLAEWNRRTQEAKPKPSENWRQNVTKKKAAEIDEAVTMGERRGNKVVVTTEIPGEGMHDTDGTIYLNPNAEHPVRQVLIHEFTHDIETSKIYSRFSKAVLDIAEKIDGADIAQMKEQIRLEEPGLDDPGIERELVARIAGSRLFTDQNMVNRLFDTDQTVFRKIKNWISDALTKAFGSEERKELLQAEKLYLRAMNSRGQVDGVGEGQNFHSSNLENDIDLVISTKNVRDQIRIRDFTPKELVDRGIDDKPFYMNSSHLRQNVLTEEEARKLGFVVNKDTNYHGLGKEGFIAAIDAMDNVIEVYRWKKNGKNSYDENDYIVITQEKDAEGNTIIIPFHIKSTAFENKVEIGVNEIKSVYGKENIRDYLESWKSRGALTKVKNKRTQDVLAGVQFPWRDNSSSFTPENIAQTGEKVNSQNGDNFKGSSYEDMLAAQNRRTDGRTANEIISDIEETFENGVEMRDQARAVLNRLSALTQEREKQIAEDEIEGRTIIGERTAPEVKTGRAKKSIDIQRRYERELRGGVR